MTLAGPEAISARDWFPPRAAIQPQSRCWSESSSSSAIQRTSPIRMLQVNCRVRRAKFKFAICRICRLCDRAWLCPSFCGIRAQKQCLPAAAIVCSSAGGATTPAMAIGNACNKLSLLLPIPSQQGTDDRSFFAIPGNLCT